MIIETYVTQRGEIGYQNVPLLFNSDCFISFDYPNILYLSNGNNYRVADEYIEKFRSDIRKDLIERGKQNE